MSGDENFLARWSRRKLAAKHEPPPADPVAPAMPAAGVPGDLPAAETAPAPLPAIDSLTPESDFAAFMQPKVDPGLRRQALKTLFADPRFNVMDGLDVYIDDYSKPDPLPEGWLEKMNQVARLGAYEPPKEAEGEAVEPAAEAGHAAEEAPVAVDSPPPEVAPGASLPDGVPPDGTADRS